MYELQKEVKNYERKVEIAERGAKIHQQKQKHKTLMNNTTSINTNQED
jgi:hypothetical protein